MNLTESMLMWIILGFGWLGVLFAGVSLFRVAGYADKKVRSIARRSRSRQDDQAA
jgi:type IV secretory pathway TrbD component